MTQSHEVPTLRAGINRRKMEDEESAHSTHRTSIGGDRGEEDVYGSTTRLNGSKEGAKHVQF